MAPPGRDEILSLREKDSRALEKYVSRSSGLDGLFGMTNIDWQQLIDIRAVKTLLTGNAPAHLRPTLHRMSKVGAEGMNRFTLVQWCIDHGMPCCSLLTILDSRGLLGVDAVVGSGQTSRLHRIKDIESLYGERMQKTRPLRRPRPDTGALAYVDPDTHLKWAEAGITAKQGVVSASHFNACAWRYAVWAMNDAAATLVKMKNESVAKRIKIVPLAGLE